MSLPSHEAPAAGDRPHTCQRVVIVGGAILPCSSVLVPEVGRGRERPAFATIAAVRRAARELAALDADTLLLITPRSSTASGPGVRSAASLRARFDEFGEHEVEIAADGAPDLAAEIARAGLAQPLHGALLGAEAATAVYFLQRALSGRRLLVLEAKDTAPPTELAALHDAGARLGDLPAIASARLAIVAASELSQRLYPGAPAGSHPDGERFDQSVQALLAASDLAAIAQLPEVLALNAGERLRGPLSLLHGLLGPGGCRVSILSYEAPFGAGWLTATLYP